MKNKYFFFSEIEYDFLRQRHQIFSEYLSKEYDVVFFERVPSRIPLNVLSRLIYAFISKWGGRAIFSNTSSSKNIKVIKSYLAPEINFIFVLYNRVRVRYLLADAKKSDVVHVFSNSPTLIKVAKSKGCIVVFDIIHNWWNFPYHTKKQQTNFLKSLIQADIVVTDSKPMLAHVNSIFGGMAKPVAQIPPGVEEFWLSTPVKSSSHMPYRVAFFGNLRANSDLDLILSFLDRGDYSLTLFGLLDSSLPSNVRGVLDKYHSGKLSAQKLARVLKDFDFVLLPYDKSEFSKTIFPAKYFESLALGLPIISNSQMSHLPKWDDLIWTTDQLTELGPKKLIELHFSTRYEKQIHLAHQNTWTERVNRLLQLLDDL